MTFRSTDDDLSNVPRLTPGDDVCVLSGTYRGCEGSIVSSWISWDGDGRVMYCVWLPGVNDDGTGVYADLCSAELDRIRAA